MNEVGQSDLESIAQSCCPGLTAEAVGAARRWAAVFKALADPTRLLILSLVAKNEGGVCECHVVDCTPLSQPTISYHVKVLKEAGLLTCEKRGLWCYYALGKDVLRQVAAALGEMGTPVPLMVSLSNHERSPARPEPVEGRAAHRIES